MAKTYTYDEDALALDMEQPLIDRLGLLLICKEIDDGTPESETDSFIQSAHIMVCNVLDGYGLNEALLTQIERYLAAHFAVLSYPSVQREAVGPLSSTYAIGRTGTGLENTRYGQQAIALDPTGLLKEHSDGKKPVRASVNSIGTGVLMSRVSGRVL